MRAMVATCQEGVCSEIIAQQVNTVDPYSLVSTCQLDVGRHAAMRQHIKNFQEMAVRCRPGFVGRGPWTDHSETAGNLY